MFRSRGENLRSTYILLFLNVAFFMLQFQDGQKFAHLFGFDRNAVATGQIWRLFTYQFAQAGHVGLFTIPPILTLFLNLVLLALMGFAVEEQWGTGNFLRFYLMSTLTTALVAAWFNTPLMGSFFINFTLLFVYAALNRDQTFYLSTILPIRVTFLAWLALAALLTGVFLGSKANLAALAGAVVGFGYYISQRVRVLAVASRDFGPVPPRLESEDAAVIAATRNITRVAAVKRALTTGSDSDIRRLIDLAEREKVSGVNICEPVDFKPEHSDRYCIRCEGFAECTARHLRLNRPKVVSQASATATLETT
ncbi:MAG TPA: rhomboid family intramembrane serine protease [Thermoanaerobaculia bacterium]|jgi:membrane associated rhomboid family serine protease|nr:rhomboid family intramembrane serine protease [Thermoanaerobaculia bacterium]